MDYDEVLQSQREKVLARSLQRRDILLALYDRSGATLWNYLDGRPIAEEMGIGWHEFCDALMYLKGEGLVEVQGGGGAAITHYGIKEIEELFNKPSQGSQHFPAFTVNNYIANGGQQYIAVQGDMHVTHNIGSDPDLKGLANQLAKANGGTLSPEAEDLVKVLSDKPDKVGEIAAAAGKVADQGPAYKQILLDFREGLAKKVGEKTAEGLVGAGSSILANALKIMAAIELITQHH